MAAMVKQYGKQKGKEVFYASKNKGTIEGVEKTEETKMKYIDALNHSVNEAAFLAPLATGAARLVAKKGAKMLARKAAVGAAKRMVPENPKPQEEKGMEESIWNTYKLSATILAEALGLVTEGRPPYSASEKRHVHPGGGKPPKPVKTTKIKPASEKLKQRLRDLNKPESPTNEEAEPTDKEIASANRKVHTKKTVRGETPEETKNFNKSVDDVMGRKKVGADGGIEGLKAKIRAAGERSRR